MGESDDGGGGGLDGPRRADEAAASGARLHAGRGRGGARPRTTRVVAAPATVTTASVSTRLHALCLQSCMRRCARKFGLAGLAPLDPSCGASRTRAPGAADQRVRATRRARRQGAAAGRSVARIRTACGGAREHALAAAASQPRRRQDTYAACPGPRPACGRRVRASTRARRATPPFRSRFRTTCICIPMRVAHVAEGARGREGDGPAAQISRTACAAPSRPRP